MAKVKTMRINKDRDNAPDKVMRITIDYHRVTKIKPKVPPFFMTLEYAVWDYTERIVIDRKSATLRHNQNIGSGCIVQRKYAIQGGIASLLDSIDTNKLFGEVKGNPDDVIENPLETREYTITIEFKKKQQHIIQGTYDKNALPKHWSKFVNDVWQFMRFYGIGEILDPAIYQSVRRCKSDYIYCRVKFNEGSKSYYYITDDDSIAVSDYVIVPVGCDNRHSVAKVIDIEYFAKAKVPFPLKTTKQIIRKCTDEEFDLLNKNLFANWTTE